MSAFGQHRKFRPHARKTSDTQRSNPSKYQVLVISRAKHEVKKVVHIDGHTIRQAQEIKLLGMMQSSIVSLAPVFWMSRNVPPKERLRDIQKTAARETSKAGVFCRALNRQRVGTSQKIIPRERLTSQSRGGRLRKKANKENQPIFFFQPRFGLYTGGRTGSFWQLQGFDASEKEKKRKNIKQTERARTSTKT